MDKIIVRGARTHNLKNIELEIPRDKLIVITGLSGSGKSSLVDELVRRFRLDRPELRIGLLLVDPKMIELGIYDKIPHLLLPVVTDMSKACLALKWAVDEMERRYQLFADAARVEVELPLYGRFNVENFLAAAACAHALGVEPEAGVLVEHGAVAARRALVLLAHQIEVADLHHVLGEPGTQLTMRTFHTGGVAGTDITAGLPRVEELFEARMPKGKAEISHIDGTVEVLEGEDGTEHWVGFHNFFVITRYNRSVMYALAVHQLGNEIALEVAGGA